MSSEYFCQLQKENPDVSQRYALKIGIINGRDPFSINTNELDFSVNCIPPIKLWDIVAYLAQTPSSYTHELMRAYKSLEAYKYFEAGFVLKVGSAIISDHFVHVGKVKHSQKANLSPVDAWCIVSKDGSVSTAHCKCMAGNSEVCSHIGAILFAVEYAQERKQNLSCTDTLASWPRMQNQNVTIVPVREMNWGKPYKSCSSRTKALPLSDEKLKNLLERVDSLGTTSVIMKVIEPFASKIEEKREPILSNIFQIFEDEFLDKNYTDIMGKVRTIEFSISLEDIEKVEEATRIQAMSQNWFIQRAGRITASKFKAVCKTNTNHPSLSLIKSICYPVKMPFMTRAMSWGISNEKVAIEKYTETMMAENHDCLTVCEVGLIIHPNHPELAASPDRSVFCVCCGKGCVEVKCPYVLADGNIDEIENYIVLKNSCLIKGIPTLWIQITSTIIRFRCKFLYPSHNTVIL